MARLDPQALKLITEFEGYLKVVKGTDNVVPYLCPAGVATIGYGSIFREDGTRVQLSDGPVTRAQAQLLMDLELTRKCQPAISRLIIPKLHPLMHGALVSFTYNCGEGALKGSGLRRAVNERRWQDVPKEFAKWKLGGGRVLAGLVRRRAAEAALFMRGVALLGAPEAANDNWLTEVLRAAS